MSLHAPFDYSLDEFRKWGKSKPGFPLTEKICDMRCFLFRTHMHLRFGQLSRAPLKLIRLEVSPDGVECEYLARASDPWDAGLPERIVQRHFSLQALRDAIDLRALLFRAMPDIDDASLWIYREVEPGLRELIVAGATHRNDHGSMGVHSLAMRAKVLGFRFRMEDEFLCRLPEERPGR
jgi:hypothetical protein